MTSAAQPHPIDGLTADHDLAADTDAVRQAEENPEYVGDMPDDAEDAVSFRPGEDGPGGSMDANSDEGAR